MKATPLPTFIGKIVSLAPDGTPLVLFDDATTPVEARIDPPVSREELDRAIVEQQAVIVLFAHGDTSKPTILVSRNQPPPLHRPDDESVDLDTLLAAIQILSGSRQPPSTVADGIRMRLRELQTPIRLARHADLNFCINALARLPEVTHDLSPERRQELLELMVELRARYSPASIAEEKEANRWRRDAPARLKKLRRRLDAACEATRNLQKNLSDVDCPLVEPLLQSAVLSSPPAGLPSHDEVDRMTQPPRCRPDPKVALYTFFVGQCSARKDDAEVWTGKIINAITDSSLTVVEEPAPRSDGRRGCEAVRKAVERKSLDKSRRNPRNS